MISFELQLLICASVNCPCEIILLLLTYRHINVREVSDYNRNIINKVYSVGNFAIGKIINDVDFFSILEIINMTLGILMNRFIASGIYTSERIPDSGMFNIIEKSILGFGQQEVPSTSLNFRERDKKCSRFSNPFHSLLSCKIV
jgi:hypothetical protein